MDRATHYKNIYQNKTTDYEFLISKEDHLNNLLPTLSKIAPLKDSTVIEIGAGTGRFTSMLAGIVRHITAFDESGPMLEVAEKKLKAANFSNWHLQVAQNQKLPAESNSADICLAGWTLGHLRHWFPKE